ncbi:MAG: glycosyltransferase family 2 protein [Proteobacteria bacterium]|nr:glycosyltransferase family 2 protein [Pseudomonadota bacterium]
MTFSTTHLVLIPSYNPGVRLLDTVRAAREHWAPVWVVDDGSSDGSAAALEAAIAGDPQVRLWRRSCNGGKGAAIFDGLQQAERAGFSHVLTMDADGQHPAASIVPFMAASAAAPRAMILGVPRFDASAPRERVYGRRISNWATGVETLGAGVGDSLFGFRVYPVAPLLEVMRSTRWMRRFDFDAEAVVRLFWRGVPFVNLAAPVRYFPPREGGVSHYHYVRDNVLLTGMYFRLFGSFLLQLPRLLRRRLV